MLETQIQSDDQVYGPRSAAYSITTGAPKKEVTTVDFLGALYGGLDPFNESSHLLIWADDWRSRWFDAVSGKSAAAKAAIELAQNHDVYFGLGLRPVNFGPPFKRGGGPHIVAVPGLWLEVDVAHDAHISKDLPRTDSEALALVARFPERPSIVVHSGHGFHRMAIYKTMVVCRRK